MAEKGKKDQVEEGRLRRVVGAYYFKIPVAVVTIGLLVWGIYGGWSYFSALEEFKIKEVVFVIRPENGVKENLLGEVKDTRGIVGRGFFDKGLTQEVARRLGGIPWVKSVHSVKREFPNRLRVQLEIRRAVAVYKPVVGRNPDSPQAEKGGANLKAGPGAERRDEVFYLLDEEGMVLPGTHFSWPQDQGKTPYIESRRLRIVPRAGQRMEDKGILAGVGLVRFLKENEVHKIMGLRSVDVTEVGRGRSHGESDITIWTNGGIAIKWGCPPLCGHADELSDGQKLKSLLSIVKAEGKKFEQMEYLDVRWKLPRGKKKEDKEFSAQEKRKKLEGI